MTRFLTYNIAGCEHRRHQFQVGMDALLSDIRSLDADVVALQEVHDESPADVSFLNRLRDLGYETVCFGPTLRRTDSEFGNVLMARGKADRIRELDLSVRGKESRGAIGISWRHGGRAYEVYSTHLGLNRRERYAQVARLLDWMDDPPSADDEVIRIVMGDFNEWNRFSSLNRLMNERFGRAPRMASFPSSFPVFALDRLFVSSIGGVELKWQVHRRNSRPDRFGSSDHLPVTLEING